MKSEEFSVLLAEERLSLGSRRLRGVFGRLLLLLGRNRSRRRVRGSGRGLPPSLLRRGCSLWAELDFCSLRREMAMGFVSRDFGRLLGVP